MISIHDACPRHRLAGCAMVTLLAAVSVCSADNGEGQTGSSGNQHTASNQSVSIDEAMPTASAEAVANGEQAAGESADMPKAGLASEEKRHSQAPTTLRRLRRARISGGAAGHGSPWYRTGLGALAIVLTLVGAATWAIRRWMPATRGRLALNSGALRIVGRTPLSPKHSLALIQLGRRFVMVGVTGDRVNTLCEVNDPEEVAELAASTRTPTERKPGGFDGLLLGEAADYRNVLKEEVGETRWAPARGVRARESLTDLLRKLRMLQAK